jgi:hypothetical protein
MSKATKAIVIANGVEVGEVNPLSIPDIKKKKGGAGRGQGRKRIEDKKRQLRVSLRSSRIETLGGDEVLSNKLASIAETMYQNKSNSNKQG